MTTVTPEVLAQNFLDEVYPWFGLPLQITSDNGPPFNAAVWRELCLLLGVEARHVSPHRPQSMGQVERMNGDINLTFRSLVQELFHNLAADWDLKHKLVQLQLNNRVKSSGLSALFYFFGRHPRTLATVQLPGNLELDPRSLEFVLSSQTRNDQARDTIRAHQLKMIADLDSKRDPGVTYAVGNLVMLRTDDLSEHIIPCNKHFRMPFVGPFRIVQILDPSTLELSIPEHWKLPSSRFHVSKVRLYTSRPPHVGPTVLPPGPDHVDAQGVDRFVVDHLVTHKWQGIGGRGLKGRQRLMFRVRWQGYQVADDTWCSSAALQADGCAACIQDYFHAFSLNPVDFPASRIKPP